MSVQFHATLNFFLAGAAIGLFMITVHNEGVRERTLDTCRKDHDVYECHLIAVPVSVEVVLSNSKGVE